ncbi:hypothetical protein HJB53_30575 [Rhizobium lentis]|uniref:DUF7940 domain-containing protein n=1 Tax=Rhizobium lentis TaxID=1138194 RepID=UPI001C83B4E7|nr:hypothetical protein [Rhizobium lentis]MBX5130839.1 hypothetical protein [Rhizobium lentis]
MLHRDWKKILTKALSQRFTALAILLTGVEVYFAVYGAPAFVPVGTFAALSGLTSAAAFYFRMYAQKEFDDAGK